MKTFSKPLLTICLISVTSMVFASQVPCPPAEVVAAYADRIDTVQGLGYDHFAVMMGTDQFENNFYDISSNLYWRLMAVVGVENAKAPALNQAYRQGKKSIHDVTTNMNKYAEEDGKVYLCTYGRGAVDDKVAAFSVINEGQTNSQLMKTLAAHMR